MNSYWTHYLCLIKPSSHKSSCNPPSTTPYSKFPWTSYFYRQGALWFKGRGLEHIKAHNGCEFIILDISVPWSLHQRSRILNLFSPSICPSLCLSPRRWPLPALRLPICLSGKRGQAGAHPSDGQVLPDSHPGHEDGARGKPVRSSWHRQDGVCQSPRRPVRAPSPGLQLWWGAAVLHAL